jgi:plastocyanin
MSSTMRARPVGRASGTIAAGVCAIALSSACDGDHSPKSAPPPRVESPAAPPAAPGSIHGVVHWTGAKPERKTLTLNVECEQLGHGPIEDETICVNDDSTVKYCFVAVDSQQSGPVPSEPVVVDQVNCRYTPHVFAVMVGQKLAIKNSDPFLHNVHYVATNDTSVEENFAMSLPGTKERTFTAPDKILFKCEVHPWMKAWCHVRSDPFFAVTDDHGAFTIANVPAGRQRLVMQHEKLGEQSADVVVEPGKPTTHDFTLTLGAASKN